MLESSAFPVLAANVTIAPSVGPMHGVQPIAKASPATNAPA